MIESKHGIKLSTNAVDGSIGGASSGAICAFTVAWQRPVNALGIDLVHFGVVICLNMMIGLCTPPFGGLLFVVSSLTQTPLRGVIREVMPMVYVMIGLLVVLTLVPSLVMFIPNSMAH